MKVFLDTGSKLTFPDVAQNPTFRDASRNGDISKFR